MQFLRVFQHLLPTGQAWRITITKTLRRFFEGLSTWPEDVVAFADAMWNDLFPDTTRELAKWQGELGLVATADEAADRLTLDAAWKASSGQSPSYLQSILQAAGFSVYVHEWADASSGPPYTVRDPRPYINQPLIGTFQCSTFPNQPQAFDGPGQPQCNAFIANETNYLANKDLTRRPPPQMPSEADDPHWRYVFYIGGPVWPNPATISAVRRAELERLLLKYRPTQQWIVLLLEFDDVFDDSFDDSFS